jgi:hypothetical protein
MGELRREMCGFCWNGYFLVAQLRKAPGGDMEVAVDAVHERVSRSKVIRSTT